MICATKILETSFSLLRKLEKNLFNDQRMNIGLDCLIDDLALYS